MLFISPQVSLIYEFVNFVKQPLLAGVSDIPTCILKLFLTGGKHKRRLPNKRIV